tara:strand:+ start:250 stop:774 length:525 start_codon:yes stop_codon:yes gene_type:complete
MWKGAFDTTYKLAKDYSDLQVFYTFNRAQAVGFHSFYSHYDARIDLVHYNHRLLRKNTAESQQNIYALVGLGQQNSQSVSHLGLQWDWETRQYFAMLKYDALSTQSFITSRIGFAPYIGAFDDLHTWLMLEYQSTRFDQRYSALVTPLIRLFTGGYLLEIGVGRHYFVRLMIHF